MTDVNPLTSEQSYWDACLIKTWRQARPLFVAIDMFESITGKKVGDCSLLRFPPKTYPRKIGARVFVANRLSKLGDRLWKTRPETDAQLLRSLSKSNYDTAASNEIADTMQALRKRTHRGETEVRVNTKIYSERNHSTDWNVVKGPRGKTS